MAIAALSFIDYIRKNNLSVSIECTSCAEFMEMKRHAIWHNFQRIIPQIKKSITLLLYEEGKNEFAFFSRRFLLVRSHTTLVAGTQSSTPSSIIFINVTFLLQQQKTNQNETNRSNLFNFFFFLQRRKKSMRKIIFLIVNLLGSVRGRYIDRFKVRLTRFLNCSSKTIQTTNILVQSWHIFSTET